MTADANRNSAFPWFPLGELTDRSAAQFGGKVALRQWYNGDWRTVSFTELHRMALAVAGWLISVDLKKGDRVGIVGENGPEWAITYLGVNIAGGVTVPIDNQLPPTGIVHVVENSECRFLFASRRQISGLLEKGDLNSNVLIVNLSSTPVPGTIPIEEVLSNKTPEEIALPKVSLDELASLLYTSGTTGHSKGVMLSHRNIISNVAAASQLVRFGPSDTFLSVLPIHHSFECTVGFLVPLYNGAAITYARSMKSADLMSDIRQTGVTVMVGVPLLFEKMMAGILKGINKKNRITKSVFHSLMTVVETAEKAGLEIGRKTFKGLRRKGGFETIKYFFSGGGPLDPQVGLFFQRIGITLMQGYGLTETSPITHANPPGRIKMATVGKPISEVECRIGEVQQGGVGEVEIKGPNVFMGYYKNPEATAAVMTPDGWFKTGDLGVIEDDGYLLLKGRKKNLIVTGGGKNVYPEEIEFLLNRYSYIADSLVLGIARESGYGEEVGALVFLDQEQLDQLRAQRGGEIPEQELNKMVQAAIDEVSRELADYKKIRKFKIIGNEFEKTSSKKIKRFLYSGDLLK